MKISTRGRYALRIILDIAMHQNHGFVSMKDIARRQQISKRYGDQIGMQLSQSGLLLAARGRQGGYKLIPKAQDVTVLQVLKIMEGSLAPVQCLETDPNLCERCSFCMSCVRCGAIEYGDKLTDKARYKHPMLRKKSDHGDHGSAAASDHDHGAAAGHDHAGGEGACCPPGEGGGHDHGAAAGHDHAGGEGACCPPGEGGGHQH